MSALVAGSGRIAEAERFAERSVKIFAEHFPPDDPILLRPLQMLAATRFEQGETAKAREAFNRMRLVRLERPEDRALVHGMAAALLHVEGRLLEAESEYLTTLTAWGDAGLGATADAGALLIALGSLYIEDRRLEEAGRALGKAASVIASSRDAVPMDRIKLLTARAALYCRQREWGEAERDMHDAVSIADLEARMNPAALRCLLVNYSLVLRKNHHRREARAVDVRVAALPVNGTAQAVIDVADLLGKTARSKK